MLIFLHSKIYRTDDLISDTPELVSNPKLQDEFREWAVENIENYMVNDSSIQPKLAGRISESARAYVDLFNFKKWDGTKFRRIFNLILQGTPYTSEEVAKRIISRGIRLNIGRRAVSTFFTAYVILPTIASVLGGLVYGVKSAIDGGRVMFGKDDYLFESSHGDLIDAMTKAAQSVFPSDFLDVPIFTTYIDDVIMAAYKGSTWKVEDIKDPELIRMAEEGEKILLGEDENNPNVTDTQEQLIKTQAVKDTINKVYGKGTIKGTVLQKIYWDTNDSKAYYQFSATGKPKDWTPMEIRIKNLNSEGEVVKGVTKIFIVKVVNGKEMFKEINTLQ